MPRVVQSSIDNNILRKQNEDKLWNEMKNKKKKKTFEYAHRFIDKLLLFRNWLIYNLFSIVDVLASTEAFVGTICQGGDTYQEGTRQFDKQRRGVLPTFPHLRQPKMSGERQLDRPFRWRLQSRQKRKQ